MLLKEQGIQEVVMISINKDGDVGKIFGLY